MENPEFLKKKYDLHTAPEVEQAARRKEKRTGERVPPKPAERIQTYLDRFQEILERPDPDKRERGMEALKRVLYDKFVIKPEDIPEAYFLNQRRLAREQGHGDIEITDELREQGTEVIITDQKSSLDSWIDYLSSKDATYPDWLKYYAFRSILGIGEYDKEKKQFTKRSKGTVKPFPDLNREALAYVLDAIEQKHAGIKNFTAINMETDEAEYKEFEKFLAGENFAKLYAWAIEKVTPASREALANTKGQWVKYDQNSDHLPLVESLQGHGTGWCTAGESTAATQLKGGDFYVYYSLDEKGKLTIPRAAIRMQENSIAEVRGIGPDQNLDPYIGDVVKKKLTEFPDGQAYEKKVGDMKKLTELEKKTKLGQSLAKDDLIFLYEINQPIEGFGYQRDPRIAELRKTRNPEEDAPIVLDCLPSQIAHGQNEINKNTKAYIGNIFPGIFQTNLEHIYTSFPEGKIKFKNIELGFGPKTAAEFSTAIKAGGHEIGGWAKDILNKAKFENIREKKQVELVILTVVSLGFRRGATRQEIYDRALELGLELSPAEVGPGLRVQYKKEDQPKCEYLFIGMEPITDSDGNPYVFRVERRDDGESSFCTDNRGWAHNQWNPGDRWVFVRRK